MVDALARKSDEGRGVAAIRFGEVPSNLWSEDVRMGKPHMMNSYDLRSYSTKERTLGSKTFQYQVENKQTCISSVAASEREED